MPKYKVKVIRTSFAAREIEITAKTPANAVRLAHAEAGNHLYDEFDAMYDVESIQLATPRNDEPTKSPYHQ